MFNKPKKEKRFKIKEEQALAFGGLYVVVDTMTGVNYLVTTGTSPSALTPLLDAEGKVVVDREYLPNY